MSSGLIYPPNAFATVEELGEVAKAAKGGLYASHVRYDGLKLRDGIEEAIAIGERGGIPVYIFHIKVTGQKNFGRMKEVIALVEAARARGIRITADQYPYVASSTSLTATIPPWAQDGGNARLIQRLKNKQERARIRKEMENTVPAWESRYQSAGTWQNVQLAAIGRTRGGTNDPVSPNRKDEGMRVAEAAKQAGGSVRLRLRSADRGARVGGLRLLHHRRSGPRAGDEAAVGGHRLGPIGTRGRGPASRRRAPPPQLRHVPACARPLRARAEGDPARRGDPQDTSLPASILGLADRGAIKEGQWADLVMFNPATVADKATFEDPFQYPVGIDTVLVNGTVVFDEGKHTNARPGNSASPRGRTEVRLLEARVRTVRTVRDVPKRAALYALSAPVPRLALSPRH